MSMAEKRNWSLIPNQSYGFVVPAVAGTDKQIRTVDKTRLVQSAGNLSQEDMQMLNECLRQILSL